MTATTYGNRFIQKKNGIISPIAPRQENFIGKIAGDYPSTPQVYLDIAEMYSQKTFKGRVICDELLEFIQHIFTEEEASIRRLIKPGSGECTASSIAKLAGRPVHEVQEILDRLAYEKRVIMSYGKGEKKAYLGIPIAPGMFEMALVRTSMNSLTPWHKRFAELFMKLFESGYLSHRETRQPIKEEGEAQTKRKNKQPAWRYLPINQTIETGQMALPSDKLEEIFTPFKIFAVGLCQCRMTEEIVGRGCGRPMENCASMGNIAEAAIKAGRMRKVELEELLEIKAAAEASGLVTMAMNAHPDFGSNTSCSCCGCCCHALRTISEFSLPSRMSPPHFLPNHDSEKCNYCGACALSCPMGAITVDIKGRNYQHNSDRCIGCGQCAVACKIEKAMTMEAVPDYKPPIEIPFGRMF